MQIIERNRVGIDSIENFTTYVGYGVCTGKYGTPGYRELIIYQSTKPGVPQAPCNKSYPIKDLACLKMANIYQSFVVNGNSSLTAIVSR